MSEPTYEAGQVDRRDTDAEPDNLNARTGEAAGQGDDPDAYADTDADPANLNPRTGGQAQRQEDEGHKVDPG